MSDDLAPSFPLKLPSIDEPELEQRPGLAVTEENFMMLPRCLRGVGGGAEDWYCCCFNELTSVASDCRSDRISWTSRMSLKRSNLSSRSSELGRDAVAPNEAGIGTPV